MKDKSINWKKIIETCVIVFMLEYGLNSVANDIRPSYFNTVMGLNIDEGVIRCLMYMGHVIFFAVFALYAWAVEGDRKYIFSFLHGKPSRNLRYALIGAVTGFGLMAICILAASLHGDITVTPASTMTAPVAILALIAVFIQASVEEIKIRGFVFEKLIDEKVPMAVAVAVSALLFTYLHIWNSGFGFTAFLSLTMIGVLYALSVYYFKTIWFAFTAHMMWNYSQDFLFGLPDSGSPAVVSFFNSTVNSSGFFFDEAFGIEGGMMAVLVNVAACIAVVLIGRKMQSKEKAN